MRLPHSKTLSPLLACHYRREVLECGSPMPLSLFEAAIALPFVAPKPLRFGVSVLLTSAATREVDCNTCANILIN
jgi:hypothetical protein